MQSFDGRVPAIVIGERFAHAHKDQVGQVIDAAVTGSGLLTQEALEIQHLLQDLAR